jgi:PilZ domain
VKSGIKASPEKDSRTGKLIHLALPVRWSLVGQEGRAQMETACTYDIHPRGARLVRSHPVGARELQAGDLLTVERGRSKAVCQVVWAADPASPLRGQFTVQCVDDARTPWEDELRQMEERYQPVIVDEIQRRAWASGFGRGDQNRRRRPRFEVDGQAEVSDGRGRAEGKVEQLSEYGARIAAEELLKPGTDFRLMLNIFDISVALKAQVKYLVGTIGMGVEFQEIRLGDRPLLGHLLKQLRTQRVEEFVPVEVEVVPLVAAAG